MMSELQTWTHDTGRRRVLFSHSSYEERHKDGVKYGRSSPTLQTSQVSQRSPNGMTCKSMETIQPPIPSQGVA